MKQNKTQHNSDKQTVKVSDLSAGNVSKHEFLTSQKKTCYKKLLQSKDLNIQL